MSVESIVEVPPPPPAARAKRPLGLTLIAIFWLLAGLWNIYAGLSTISLDLEVVPYLDNPALDPWFQLGIPAEMAIAALAIILGAVQLIVIYGLWTGKPWSYKPALTIPILIAASWWATLALYLSAPPSLGIFAPNDLVYATSSLLWVGVFWWYLRRRHVKDYLRVK